MKRILIMHISEFGGHKRASQNIEEALRFIDPTIKTMNINGLGRLYPRSEKIVDLIYTTTIKRLPRVWGKVYDRHSVVKTVTPLMRVANMIGFGKFASILKDFRPDAIVATQAFPCSVAAEFKKKHNLSLPLFAVVTDYHPHRFWIHPNVNTYIVACQEAKDTLMREGIKEDKIKILGIPISYRFLDVYKKEDIAREYGFDLQSPCVLIMGGGLGFGPIKDVFVELNKIDLPFQVIVVCGKNKTLYRWFKKRRNRFRRPVFYFGYIDFVNKLMDFSDIIITKAGGVTISEALSKELGIIVINPIPGQEERNVEYLTKRKAILKAGNILEVRNLVERLLNNREELAIFKQSAKENSIRDSSLRIAYFIIDYLS